MSYGAMELPGGPKAQPRKLHRQAMAAIAGFSALTLAAVCVVLSRGTVYTGLLEVQNPRVPFTTMQQLAAAPVWAHEQMLSQEKTEVGAKLATDMRKYWTAKGANKKADKEAFEKLHARFESILAAMDKAPVLKRLPETSRSTMRVVDPRTGQVYQLYAYDPALEGAPLVPNDLMAGDMKGLGDFEDGAARVHTYQGTYPDYDTWDDFQGNIHPSGAAERVVKGSQVLYPYDSTAESNNWVVNPLFAGDLKGLGDFATDPAARVHTYQGTYPDYDTWDDFQGNIHPSGGAAERVLGGGQTLYPYDPAAEGAAWAVNPIFANDMKGYHDFATDPATRVPTYQGVYPDYATWNDFQGNIAPSSSRAGSAAPEVLAGQAPVMLAVMDAEGHLRLLDPAEIQGLQVQQLAAHQRALAARRHMMVQLRQQQGAAAHAPAPKSKGEAKHGKSKGEAKKGVVEMLADLDESGQRTWGKVYSPKLLALPKEAAIVDPNPLSRQARNEFSRWAKLADNLNDVYDPAEDHKPSHNMPRAEDKLMAKNGNWWDEKKFQSGGSASGNDDWWVHPHKNRGY